MKAVTPSTKHAVTPVTTPAPIRSDVVIGRSSLGSRDESEAWVPAALFP